MTAKKDFRKDILYDLYLIFPEVSLGEDEVYMYHELLKDIDIDLLHRAAREYMRTGRTFPKPIDLREVAERLFEAETASASLIGAKVDL
jgi:hypothetical protein